MQDYLTDKYSDKKKKKKKKTTHFYDPQQEAEEAVAANANARPIKEFKNAADHQKWVAVESDDDDDANEVLPRRKRYNSDDEKSDTDTGQEGAVDSAAQPATIHRDALGRVVSAEAAKKSQGRVRSHQAPSIATAIAARAARVVEQARIESVQNRPFAQYRTDDAVERERVDDPMARERVVRVQVL